MIDSFNAILKHLSFSSLQFLRHPRECGIHLSDYHWIPACAGMTKKEANCKLFFSIFEGSQFQRQKGQSGEI